MLIPGIVNEMFIKDLVDKVAISAGSACGISEPSYVIKEINKSAYTNNFIRLSLNKNFTLSDILYLKF
jgi:cysteine desulfurase